MGLVGERSHTQPAALLHVEEVFSRLQRSAQVLELASFRQCEGHVATLLNTEHRTLQTPSLTKQSGVDSQTDSEAIVEQS